MCRLNDFTRNNKTILVVPLDWGLGHATRCIPVIRCLISCGCKVILAASGNHAALLQQEFPELTILPLAGYGIRYGKGNLIFQLLKQLPSFFKSIKNERRWLHQVIEKYKIDGVISDNRYGLHSTKVPCVFITHQLQVQAPGWIKWSEKLARQQIFRLINNFTECWVPDEKDFEKNLGKKLSHPSKLPPIPVRYIGWLTRFYPIASGEKLFRLMISLSGPEPQRTILEDTLLSQLPTVEGNILLVRGLPGSAKAISISLPNLTVINHLPAAEMQTKISQSTVFLSRCGYSTLMDLQAVSVRCVFIPTPGQTEQEYLGREIAKLKKAIVVNQEKIDLNEVLLQAEKLPPFSKGNYANTTMTKVVQEWLWTLRKN